MRKAANLAVWLPAGAAVYQSEAVDLAWTNEEHMLSAAIFHLETANWQRGGGKSQRPEPLTSPSDQAKKQARIEKSRSRARRFSDRRARRAAAKAARSE